MEKMKVEDIKPVCMWCGKEDNREEMVASFAICKECYQDALLESLESTSMSEDLKEFFPNKKNSIQLVQGRAQPSSTPMRYLDKLTLILGESPGICPISIGGETENTLIIDPVRTLDLENYSSGYRDPCYCNRCE